MIPRCHLNGRVFFFFIVTFIVHATSVVTYQASEDRARSWRNEAGSPSRRRRCRRRGSCGGRETLRPNVGRPSSWKQLPSTAGDTCKGPRGPGATPRRATVPRRPRKCFQLEIKRRN
jgi:hypothetical protein